MSETPHLDAFIRHERSRVETAWHEAAPAVAGVLHGGTLTTATVTDGPVRGPMQSARAIGPLYVRGLLLFFLVRTPIGVLHQFLGTWGIGKATPLLWPMLVLDAVVVGLLVAIIPAAYVRIVRHAAQRRPNPIHAG